MGRKKKQTAELAEHIAREDKSILEEYILDKTDLDEKAMEALDDVEKFLRARKNSLKFIWSKFRYACYILLGLGGVAGIVVGLIISSL